MRAMKTAEVLIFICIYPTLDRAYHQSHQTEEVS